MRWQRERRRRTEERQQRAEEVGQKMTRERVGVEVAKWGALCQAVVSI